MENNPETSGINQYYDMYTETSTTSIVSKGFTVAFATECLQFLYDLRWMILLAFILIIADFWLGMNASKLKGIPIIDYICYLLMGAVLGKAIGEPYGLDPLVVSITVLVVCYGFEVDSIYGHICTLHGVEKRYSIWKILWSIVTLKFNNLSEAFKDMSEQSRNYKQSKNNSNNENVL